MKDLCCIYVSEPAAHRTLACVMLAAAALVLPVSTPEAALGNDIRSIGRKIEQIEAEVSHQREIIRKMEQELAAAKREDRKPDIGKLQQMATATGQRTTAYHGKPKHIQEAIDQLEGETSSNVKDAGGLAAAWATGSFERGVYQTEIRRSTRYIGILQDRQRELEKDLREKRELLPEDIQAWLEEAQEEDAQRSAPMDGSGEAPAERGAEPSESPEPIERRGSLHQIESRINKAAGLIKEAVRLRDEGAQVTRARLQQAESDLILAANLVDETNSQSSRLELFAWSSARRIDEACGVLTQSDPLSTEDFSFTASRKAAHSAKQRVCEYAARSGVDPSTPMQQWQQRSNELIRDASQRIADSEQKGQALMAGCRRELDVLTPRLEAELTRKEAVSLLARPRIEPVEEALREARGEWRQRARTATEKLGEAETLLASAQGSVRAITMPSLQAKGERLLSEIGSWQLQRRAIGRALQGSVVAIPGSPQEMADGLGLRASLDRVDSASQALEAAYGEVQKSLEKARSVEAKLRRAQETMASSLGEAKGAMIEAIACLAEIDSAAGRMAGGDHEHAEKLLDKARALIDEARSRRSAEFYRAQGAFEKAGHRSQAAQSSLPEQTGKLDAEVSRLSEALKELREWLRNGWSITAGLESAYQRLSASSRELAPLAEDLCGAANASRSQIDASKARLDRLTRSAAEAADDVRAFEESAWGESDSFLARVRRQVKNHVQAARAVYLIVEGLLDQAEEAGRAMISARQIMSAARDALGELGSRARALLYQAERLLSAAPVTGPGNRLLGRVQTLHLELSGLAARLEVPDPPDINRLGIPAHALAAQKAMNNALREADSATAEAERLISALDGLRVAGEFASRHLPELLSRSSSCLARIEPSATSVASRPPERAGSGGQDRDGIRAAQGQPRAPPNEGRFPPGLAADRPASPIRPAEDTRVTAAQAASCFIQQYPGRGEVTLLFEHRFPMGIGHHSNYYLLSVDPEDTDLADLRAHFLPMVKGPDSVREVMRSGSYESVLRRARELCPTPTSVGMHQ